jgi:KaiC/GvpD/RAD55 family RecA-like ATPase
MTNEFLTDLFGDQEGIVYAPIKDKGWEQHFFEWPKEREKLEAHIRDFNKRDVYLSPVLFNEKRISPETFKGTNYLWTEFDGIVPKDTITPTMRVMSSNEGHEHFYWKLNEFVTDKVLVEDLTRRIAYHYGADLSCYDYQQVLRPVDTWNHKRNKPVTLLSKTDVSYSINDFLNVPIPPAGTRVSLSLGNLPTREQVLAKYSWKYDTLDLLFKNIEVGGRSSALMRLAYDAIEVGCSNEEAYVLIEERDRAWGKFTGRNDRERWLQNTIAVAVGKKLTKAELHQEPTTETFRFHDFMRSKIKLKWAIEGLLPVAGSMVILGRPSVGKTTFSLRMAMNLALGEEKFLDWVIVNRQKVLFVSLEMQHDELKQFFEDMELSEEKREELQEWFHIWPIGFAYPFDVPDQQPDLLKHIDQHGIELVIIDSLSLAMYGSVKNDDDVKRLNSYMNEDIRSKRKCGYIFIHHDRKKGIDDATSIADLDDAFGSRYITANAQTVISISQRRGSPRVHVNLLKTRMAIGMKEFDIERTPDRGFIVVGSAPTTIITGHGETASNEGPTGLSLGKMLNL